MQSWHRNEAKPALKHLQLPPLQELVLGAARLGGSMKGWWVMHESCKTGIKSPGCGVTWISYSLIWKPSVLRFYTKVYFFSLAFTSLPYFLSNISCFLLAVENCTQRIKTLVSGCKSIAMFPNWRLFTPTASGNKGEGTSTVINIKKHNFG